jgi:hypothetical protein
MRVGDILLAFTEAAAAVYIAAYSAATIRPYVQEEPYEVKAERVCDGMMAMLKDLNQKGGLMAARMKETGLPVFTAPGAYPAYDAYRICINNSIQQQMRMPFYPA